MRVIDERIVRFAHEVHTAGQMTLSQVAKRFKVNYPELKKLLSEWRQIHGLQGPVSNAAFNKAADRIIGRSIYADSCNHYFHT